VSHFGKANGKDIELYTLRNHKGAVATISTYAGTLVSLKVPDKSGELVDIALGCDSVEGYLTNCPYLGALIGRFGNRIGGASFKLDGVEHKLAANNGPNNLHSGPNGFDKRIWTATSTRSKGGASVTMRYHSADGEEGFPGNLDVSVLFTLTEENELRVAFEAKTDRATVCNLTYHPYFNLSGAGTGDILDHLLWVNAAKFTPVDSVQIPTGEIRAVAGTPLDFTMPSTIGARIDADHEQIKFGAGYDHNWVINQTKPGEITLQARATSPKTGITLEVLSSEPGVQFYSGNFLDGTVPGKSGQVYPRRSGFCLEPQHFPDSPNKPAFPSTTLRPGQKYHNTIIYKFSAK
jgi:aldose 1-epimerase